MLKGALIGTGYFSQFQIEAWQRMNDVELVALCDLSAEKARPFLQRFAIPKFYSDYRLLLEQEQLDFVDIITPPATHYDMATLAASYGVHVICQKPLAPTYEEAVALIGKMAASNVRFMVHENWRWQPWYREVKRLLMDGTLGRPFSLTFMMRTGDGWGEDAYLGRQPFFREYERLLIFETGVHFIDTFRFLLGEVTAVYAALQRRNPVIKGEDCGQLLMHHAHGATSLLDANRYNESESDDPRYTFGTLRLDAENGHLWLDNAGNLTIKRLGQPAYRHAYPHTRQGFAGDSVFALQRHFVTQLQEKRPFESEGADYLRSITLVEAAYRSANEQQVVTINP